MYNPEQVSADPCPPHTIDMEEKEALCFACNSRPNRQTCKELPLKPSQIAARAKVNTEPDDNPFRRLDNTQSTTVMLCTACRSTKTEWPAMCRPKTFGRHNVSKMIESWRSRRTKRKRDTSAKVCFVCERTGSAVSSQECSSSNRSPTRDWTLFNLTMYSETVHDAFRREFCRLTGIDVEGVSKLLRSPSECFLCYKHLNHSRYAQEFAITHAQERSGSVGGFCVFTECGCGNAGSRLRKLPTYQGDDFDTVAQMVQFQEAIFRFSNGKLHGQDVQGKYACSQCLYIVTQGQSGSAPDADIASLADTIDRWLVRCILYALNNNDSDSDVLPTDNEKLQFVSDAAKRLRYSVKEPFTGARLLPFTSVFKCRGSLAMRATTNKSRHVVSITMERRITAVLAAKNVHLIKISSKVRCYVVGQSMETLFSNAAKFPTVVQFGLSHKERRNLLDRVSKSFQRKGEQYWKGDWNLDDEISRIPHDLWKDYVLQMSSGRKLSSWHVAAVANEGNIDDVFPVSNRLQHMPRPSIEQCLSDPNTEYSRSDMLLCVRVLKVIEQIIFSRSNSVAGPLTTCLSIAGIVELTPSFRSVEKALGLSLSYNKTEAYKHRLIAEREKASRGAWESIPCFGESNTPYCQFDNWDHLPFHAVKAEGKAMPKVNGTVVQGVCRKRSKIEDVSSLSPRSKRRRLQWKPVTVLGSRDEFAESFTSPATKSTLEEFYDIVFGLVLTHRDKLLSYERQKNSNPESAPITTRRDTALHLTNKSVINFRSLLLSAFKPHGGCMKNDDSPNDDQHVAYIDISRESSSDILTVRRMLELTKVLLTPGEPGCPRFVVVSGDQPSYKMIVDIWLESWRQSRVTDDQSAQNRSSLRLHEWLVPFPGFFHAEKQALYSLCKETLDGIGLT